MLVTDIPQIGLKSRQDTRLGSAAAPWFPAGYSKASQQEISVMASWGRLDFETKHETTV